AGWSTEAGADLDAADLAIRERNVPATNERGRDSTVTSRFSPAAIALPARPVECCFGCKSWHGHSESPPSFPEPAAPAGTGCLRLPIGSDRANFGKPRDGVFVVPADGGFPGGRRLRGDVVCAVGETGGIVGQHQVEVGDVDMRLVPVDQRDPLRGHADVAR